MDFIMLACLVFALVYLCMEQIKLAASQRFARSLASRGRATLTATKWGYVLSMRSNR